MKLLFVLVGLILFCKGIEKGSNWLFFGGLIINDVLFDVAAFR